MKLSMEEELEKEILKRYLEKNPEQAAKIVGELLDKIIQKRHQQKKLESQYDDLLQRYINLHDAYIANLQLINQNNFKTTAKKIIQPPQFIKQEENNKL